MPFNPRLPKCIRKPRPLKRHELEQLRDQRKASKKSFKRSRRRNEKALERTEDSVSQLQQSSVTSYEQGRRYYGLCVTEIDNQKLELDLLRSRICVERDNLEREPTYVKNYNRELSEGREFIKRVKIEFPLSDDDSSSGGDNPGDDTVAAPVTSDFQDEIKSDSETEKEAQADLSAEVNSIVGAKSATSRTSNDYTLLTVGGLKLRDEGSAKMLEEFQYPMTTPYQPMECVEFCEKVPLNDVSGLEPETSDVSRLSTVPPHPSPSIIQIQPLKAVDFKKQVDVKHELRQPDDADDDSLQSPTKRGRSVSKIGAQKDVAMDLLDSAKVLHDDRRSHSSMC